MYRTTLMLTVAVGALAFGPGLAAETVPAGEQQAGESLQIDASQPAADAAGQPAADATGDNDASAAEAEPDAAAQDQQDRESGSAESDAAPSGQAASADADPAPPAGACRERLGQLQADMGDQGAGAGSRAARTLRDAALVLAETGRTESCLAVVDSLEAVLSDAPSTGAIDPAALEEMMAGAQSVDQMTVQIRASRLLDSEVIATDGEEVGEIEDIVLSGTDGRRWILVETGGFWGMGEDFVPIALSRLHMLDDETYAVQVGADLFGEAPRFDDEEIAGTSGWADEADSWWANNSPAGN